MKSSYVVFLFWLKGKASVIHHPVSEPMGESYICHVIMESFSTVWKLADLNCKYFVMRMKDK